MKILEKLTLSRITISIALLVTVTFSIQYFHQSATVAGFANLVEIGAIDALDGESDDTKSGLAESICNTAVLPISLETDLANATCLLSRFPFNYLTRGPPDHALS